MLPLEDAITSVIMTRKEPVGDATDHEDPEDMDINIHDSVNYNSHIGHLQVPGVEHYNEELIT